MSTTWEWPGSHWWRVDLHAHTPASYDFNSQSAGEDPDWPGWITAAHDAGIQAIAITDHNTAEAVGPLQEAAAQIEGAPVLFPGVELTASGGWHLLVLLDPKRKQQHVEDLLSKVGISTDQRGRSETQSSHSVEQILDELGNDALILGAHANGPKGLLQLSGEQRIAVLRHPSLAAVEINPDRETEEEWFNGSRSEIGRRISQVWSSDGHSRRALGQRFTWVKMTRPDLEGLRLALLDGAGSLETATEEDPGDPNTYGSLALESITVRKAKHMGRPDPTTVTFNPWLNVIIGGRGTGKSTLIDFCRKTLRRESELDGSEGDEEGPLREYFNRRMSVPNSRTDEGLVTEGTLIEIVYRKDGERFVLSWSQKGDAHPIDRFHGSERSPQEGNIRERFPVRIYSQKQLFSLARDQNALLTVIDDSQTVRRVELDRDIERLRNQYLSLRAEAREARNRATDLPSRQADLEDINNKLEVLQQGGNAQAWKDYRTRRRQDDIWQAILHEASRVVKAVEKSAEELSVPDLNLGTIVEDDHAVRSLRCGYESLRRTVENVQRDVREALNQARQEIGEIRSGADIDQWRRALTISENAFHAASEWLAEKGISDPNQYERLLGRALDLKREIESLNGEKIRAAELERKATEVLTKYRNRRRELSDRRNRFTDETSSDIIRVEVSGFSSNENIMHELQGIFGTERYRDDRKAIARRIWDEQQEVWNWKGLDEMVAEMRRFLLGETERWQTKDRRFETFLRKVNPERIDRLALYLPEDTVRASFRDHEADEWKPLNQGSPGQQTAALLAFVLGYGDEPILLDQPEDDLDSALIYELLVSRLRETKLKRQVIVVTHNPNIVVHGDAELVLSLDAGSGQSRIKCKGGLQEKAVRDEICRVMEGGREAFKSRYRRIMSPKMTGS